MALVFLNDEYLSDIADSTQKQWINTNHSIMTNVQTVAEYEG